MADQIRQNILCFSRALRGNSPLAYLEMRKNVDFILGGKTLHYIFVTLQLTVWSKWALNFLWKMAIVYSTFCGIKKLYRMVPLGLLYNKVWVIVICNWAECNNNIFSNYCNCKCTINLLILCKCSCICSFIYLSCAFPLRWITGAAAPGRLRTHRFQQLLVVVLNPHHENSSTVCFA